MNNYKVTKVYVHMYLDAYRCINTDLCINVLYKPFV